jgi:hypothetical protein
MERRETSGLKRVPRRPITVGTAAQRSAVANGSRLLDGLDGRSAPARRYRDIAVAIATDLGGYDSLTEAQLQLVRSAAGLTVLREALDAKALNGERIDVGEYCRISNSLRRLLSTIGLDRTSRDVTPSVSEYVAQRAATARMEAAE